MPPSLIEAITFDAAGTLIHLAEPVGVSYSRVAAEFGIAADSDDLGLAFASVWKRTPLPFADENRAEDPHEKAWWRRLVREVFLEAQAKLPNEERFEDFFNALYRHFESPGTFPTPA